MPGSTWSNTFITTQSIVFMLRSFVFTESLPIVLAIRPFSITILLLCFSKSAPVSFTIRFVGFTPCLVKTLLSRMRRDLITLAGVVQRRLAANRATAPLP